MPRRPNKRKRKKEADEGKGGKKPACAFREFKQRRCGNCGNIGHYKKGDVLYASNMYILISVVYVNLHCCMLLLCIIHYTANNIIHYTTLLH